MPESIIEVRDLVKRYGELIAVDNISFDVFEGEIFSLVGPNGAGKTTTVEILECLRKPTSGEAELFDLDVMEHENRIKGRIGVLPQEFNTFERLSVEENVRLVADIYGSESSIKENLESLDLWEVRDKKFEELSGGMKRRVGIAMALISDPELLFLDEPTTGLDPQARRRMWRTIDGLKEEGVTVFLTTHYMEEVEELSDRAAIILNGKILSADDVGQLVSRYGGDMKIVVEDEHEARPLLKEYADDVFIDDGGKLVGTFKDREKVAQALLPLYEQLPEESDVEVVRPSMDDVFLQVAGKRIDERGELVE